MSLIGSDGSYHEAKRIASFYHKPEPQDVLVIGQLAFLYYNHILYIRLIAPSKHNYKKD